MNYHYKMLQVPPIIDIAASASQGGEAAAYLQNIVNREAREGWEFYRVDTIGIKTTPGCLASLFGQKTEVIEYYVVTFRKGF